MTVEAEILSNQYAGNGSTTEFEFGFKVFDDDEIVVTLIENATGVPSVQSKPTHYTVSLNDDGTGSVTMITAPASGYTLDLRPVYDLLQPTNVRNQGRFLPEIHETALDRLTLFIQYLFRLVRRSIRLPDYGDSQSGEMVPLDNWRGKYLFVNEDGQLEPSTAVAIQTLTQSVIGAVLYPISTQENTAGLTNANLDRRYYYGDLRRYLGTGGSSSADTLAFTNALAAGHEIRIPKVSSAWQFTGPILIPSNTVIWCDPGVEVMMPDGGLVSDIGWIRFRDVENVTIHGNNSRWFFQTKPVADEQRHVFDIRGSSNVTIRDTTAEASGGDGYYVGAGATNLYSQNVYLENVRADNCRRQGLSIVSAINCWVNGAVFENISGTSPQAGVDIEPNVATDELRGIRLHNVITRDCTGAGIKAVINDLPANYPVDIVITGHRDTGSENAFNPQYGTQMAGRIVYRDGHSYRARGNGIHIRGWRSVSCPLVIESPVIDDPNEGNDITNAYNGNGIGIFSTGSDAADDIGNITIVNPTIRDRRGSPRMKACIYARNFVGGGTSSNIRVINPVELDGYTVRAVTLTLTSDILLEDPLELTRSDKTADFTVSNSELHALFTNAGAAGTITASLDSSCPTGYRVRFRVESAQEFRVDPDLSSSILPGGGAGVRLVNNVIGSEIELLRISATVWYITRAVGIWTFSNGSESVNAGFLEGSNTWDPPSVADGDVVTRLVTVTGAALGDFAVGSFSLDTGDLDISAKVVAADTVKVTFTNNTGAPVDLASGTVRARVYRRSL